MRQRPALGVLGKAQQRRCCGMGRRQVLCVEARQAGHLQLFTELALAQGGIELPGRPAGERGAPALQAAQRFGLGGGFAADQQLGRLQARQPGAQLRLGAHAQAQGAAAQAQPGQAPVAALHVQRQQQGVHPVVEQFGVGHGAGRDDAHHLALHRALGGGHVAHLLGDGHGLAQADQLGQVGLHRMHRHPGHHHGGARALTARGQRDVEQAVGLARVVEEQLVEIPHAVEDQRVGVLLLDAQVLLHHGRVRRQLGVARRGNARGGGHGHGVKRARRHPWACRPCGCGWGPSWPPARGARPRA